MFTEKHVLPKKMFINGQLNMCLLLRSWVEKIVHEVERLWLFGGEKILGSVIS